MGNLKLLLEEITSKSEKVQEKVKSDIKEAYRIFLNIDYKSYLEFELENWRKKLEEGNRGPFGIWTNEFLTEQIKEVEEKIKKFRKQGIPPKSSIITFEDEVQQIYRELVTSVTSNKRDVSRDMKVVYRLDSYSFGARAHLFFEFDSFLKGFMLDIRSNSCGNFELEEYTRHKLHIAWFNAVFLVYVSPYE